MKEPSMESSFHIFSSHLIENINPTLSFVVRLFEGHVWHFFPFSYFCRIENWAIIFFYLILICKLWEHIHLIYTVLYFANTCEKVSIIIFQSQQKYGSASLSTNSSKCPMIIFRLSLNMARHLLDIYIYKVRCQPKLYPKFIVFNWHILCKMANFAWEQLFIDCKIRTRFVTNLTILNKFVPYCRN